MSGSDIKSLDEEEHEEESLDSKDGMMQSALPETHFWSGSKTSFAPKVAAKLDAKSRKQRNSKSKKRIQ